MRTPPFSWVVTGLARVNAEAAGACKQRFRQRFRVNRYNLNQLQSYRILFEFDSSIDRIRRVFYLHSSRLDLTGLAATQKLPAQCGPNKKRGPQCLISGDRGREWRWPPCSSE